MSKIENYNCEGLCSEEFCDKRYTHFYNFEIGNIKVLIPFCYEHYEKFHLFKTCKSFNYNSLQNNYDKLKMEISQ